MLLKRFEYEVLSLIERISSGRLDLQPPFQRGMVWSDAKRKKLIDSILRNWYVPPIHVVVNEGMDKDEILDGQQRLRAIFDFYQGKFSIDGYLEPPDDQISDLDGLFYDQLPTKVKSRFHRFVITTVRLEEFEPSEPGELFFRLNQPAALTSAEQRNALIGPARDQIRILSKLFEDRSDGRSVGFTNARMNFDDILSRVALTLEAGTLYEKVTAARLASRYRKGVAFDKELFRRLEKGIIKLARIIQDAGVNIKFNKATLYSWFIFFIENDWISSTENMEDACDFVTAFELSRTESSSLYYLSGQAKKVSDKLRNDAHELIRIFNDRASSRVNDVSSVILRDFCLHSACIIYGPTRLSRNFQNYHKYESVLFLQNMFLFESSRNLPDVLERQLDILNWGRTI